WCRPAVPSRNVSGFEEVIGGVGTCVLRGPKKKPTAPGWGGGSRGQVCWRRPDGGSEPSRDWILATMSVAPQQPMSPESAEARSEVLPPARPAFVSRTHIHAGRAKNGGRSLPPLLTPVRASAAMQESSRCRRR